jgi:hypothetical protein
MDTNTVLRVKELDIEMRKVELEIKQVESEIESKKIELAMKQSDNELEFKKIEFETLKLNIMKANNNMGIQPMAEE